MKYFVPIILFFMGHSLIPSPSNNQLDGNPSPLKQAVAIKLFDEHIEGVYYNYWNGYLLHDNILLITADGKTKGFRGFLSYNCENGSYSFEGASNFGNCLETDSDIEKLVPEEVIKKCREIICEK